MAIRPVDFGGMIQRTDDIAALKKHEDTKPLVDQQNIQMQVNKRDKEMQHKVIKSDESNEANNNQDAKDEGKGQYFITKKYVKKNKKSDKVLKENNSSTFDMMI